VWCLTEAITDSEDRGRELKGKVARVGYALRGITHIILATAEARLALRQISGRSGTPSDDSAQSWSAWPMNQPGSVILLVLVGGGFFAVAAAQGIKSYRARFDELDGDVPAPNYVRWMGRLGYAARGLIFALISWFLITAALNYDADRAGRLGEALGQSRAQDGGAIILGIVVCGLAFFGMLSMFEARYCHMKVTKPALLQ
jgi:hypothetical protein